MCRVGGGRVCRVGGGRVCRVGGGRMCRVVKRSEYTGGRREEREYGRDSAIVTQ